MVNITTEEKNKCDPRHIVMSYNYTQITVGHTPRTRVHLYFFSIRVGKWISTNQANRAEMDKWKSPSAYVCFHETL